MKSRVQVEAEDSRLKSLLEEMIANLLWNQPKKFEGCEGKVMEFKVTITFDDTPIGESTGEVS